MDLRGNEGLLPCARSLRRGTLCRASDRGKVRQGGSHGRKMMLAVLPACFVGKKEGGVGEMADGG
jgi:hypothetical protein